jgi:hypothetical protein
MFFATVLNSEFAKKVHNIQIEFLLKLENILLDFMSFNQSYDRSSQRHTAYSIVICAMPCTFTFAEVLLRIRICSDPELLGRIRILASVL